MSTTLRTPRTTTGRQSVTLCVLVATAIVVAWVLYRHYVFAHLAGRIVGWAPFGNRFWVVDLVSALLLSLPYAVALLLWGRDLSRAAAGATTALASGLYLWALDQVFANYVWDSRASTATSLRIFTWASLLVVAALVPLAWGLARRSGRDWILGILVGPAVAALLHELVVHSSWWQREVALYQHRWSWVLQAVVYVAPFVLAALACWAIEVRGRASQEVVRSTQV